MKLPFRSVAKFAVKTSVGAVASNTIDIVVDATTEIDTETRPFQVASAVGGYVIAEKCSPYTDATVDFVADRLPKRKPRIKTDPETPQVI